MNLGENIYRLRTEKNMSQGDLADALDVSRQSVSKWENNSATPELDKLIKMSELFDVTLDALVGKSQSTKEPTAPPVQQVVIQHQFHPISLRKIIAAVLLVIGFLFLPLALSATSFSPMVTCLILFGGFGLCGLSVLLFRYPYIPCGWVALSALALYVFLLCRWESAYFLLAVIGLSLAGMIWWTIRAHQSGKFPIPNWLWWAGGILLAVLLILFCVNIVPPFWITSTEHTVNPS